MRYFVQEADSKGEHWFTLAEYDDVHRAIAIAKALRDEDLAAGRFVELLVVDEESERCENRCDDLGHIERALALVDNEERGRFDQLAEAGAQLVTEQDVARFLW